MDSSYVFHGMEDTIDSIISVFNFSFC